MGLNARKPVFFVSNQVIPKQAVKLQRLAIGLKFSLVASLYRYDTFQQANRKGEPLVFN